MNIRTLRTVLLIQSIEESDRTGEVLPLADRAEATRTMTREAPSALADAFLGGRAEILLERLRARSPGVDHVLALAGGLSWLGRVVVLLALLGGLSLSALDGSRRINILGFPLLGLLAWNGLVYAILLASRLSHRRAPAGASPWAGRLYERWISGQIDSLLRQSSQFNAPLSTGLKQFSSRWAQIARPYLIMRATRLMHLAAAALGLGLVGGLYVRGLVLRYEAGWESTFLGPRTVHFLVQMLYGPAAALAGMRLPGTEGISTLRWNGTSGGGEAAVWIHLSALTAALYIFIPRLILAAVAGIGHWGLSRRPTLPPALQGYARALRSSGGEVVRETVHVTPYAFEPGPESIAGVETLLAAVVGSAVLVQLHSGVRYGEEDSGLRAWKAGAESGTAGNLGPGPAWQVLLMGLASTPEVENHGSIIREMRDSLGSGAVLLVVVDKGPYAARMRGDASFEQRLRERTRLWSDFVAGYGMRACVVDLPRIVADSGAENEARDAVRAALWTPGRQA